MAKVTRIKASDAPRKGDEEALPAITRKKVVVKDKKTEKAKTKEKKLVEKKEKELAEKKTAGAAGAEKKPFILWRPLVYLGRYIRDAWRELRQVRWPNRKTTWKMVLAVLVYTALFVVIISLLDLLFKWLLGLVLGS